MKDLIEKINARRDWNTILGQDSGLSRSQHQERLIGASDIAAIMNLLPFNWKTRKGPLDVYLDFYGLRQKEPMSEAQQEGILKEAYLANMYVHRTGLPLVRMDKAVIHPEIPYLTVHLDRAVKGQRLPVELKNVGWRMRDYWEEGVPVYVLTQVYAQMIAWETDHADVGADIETQGYQIFRVEMKRDIRDMILDAVHEFWNNYIVPMKPPPIDATATATKFLLNKFPAASELVEEATPIGQAHLNSMRTIKKMIAELEQREGMQENILRNFIGERKGINWTEAGLKAQWINIKGRKTIDYSALFEAFADAAVAAKIMTREQVSECLKNATTTGEPSRQLRFTQKPKAKK